MQDELWLPIFGLHDCGYEVSNLGRVRSWRYCTWKEEVPRILKPVLNDKGYYRVSINLHGERKRQYLVHRLVARTFMCATEEREQVNHIDGNPTNNELSNLEWCTNTENQRHARATGLNDQRGTKSVKAKWTDEQIRQIRAMSQSGVPYSKIREFFPMAKSTLSYIVNGKTY